MKHRVSVLVVDVDNTLYDWVAMWADAIRALVCTLSDAAALDRERVIEALGRAHRARFRSELVNVLEQLDADMALSHRGIPMHAQISAAAAYRTAAAAAFRPYAYVVETLHEAAAAGTRLVAMTESGLTPTCARLRLLGLEGVLSRVAATYDPWLERRPPEQLALWPALDGLAAFPARAVALPPGQVKPNPALLRELIGEYGAEPCDTLVVGDHLTKDIEVAVEVGCHAAWARFGTSRRDEDLALLDRAAHWSLPADSLLSRGSGTAHVVPQPAARPAHAAHLTLDDFADLSALVTFVPARTQPRSSCA